jgi:hypothetical protein
MDELRVSDLSLDQPALLTLWSTNPDALKGTEPIEMKSLTEALRAASLALRDGSSTPWVTTTCGLILSPAALSKLMSTYQLGSWTSQEADPSHAIDPK